MIEKMKMVHVVASVSEKKQMLNGLRDLGLMHLVEKKNADRDTIERFSLLSKTILTLKDYLPKKAEPYTKILTDEEFQSVYSDVLKAINKKVEVIQTRSDAVAEIERISPWGDFSPKDISELKSFGYDLHFYRFGKKDFENAVKAEDIKLVRLGTVDKQITAAVFGKLPPEIQATEFALPKKSIEELKEVIQTCNSEEDKCDEILKNASLYEKSFQQQLLKLQNEEEYSSANETASNDTDLVWISGYIPEVDIPKFKEAAEKSNWAWAVQDVDDEDSNVPTKVRYNKVSRLIKPVFDILGVLPGYHEQDISLWFFLFFILFFAMIIGDGGYGLLLLIGTIIISVKSKKKSDVVFLLYVLSIATIVWGAVTGTWFGMEQAMDIPFLKALVIPSFANYPEYFGVAATAQQNTIIKFSFSIGAIQMALGSILSIKKKLPEKDLSWIASAGWALAVIAMYLLSLFLVIGEPIDIVPVAAMVGIAFVLVLLFGGMSPDKTFKQGLLAGVANAFTVFLDTISCFGNVMSYIRLFAVGMAGLAIAQSFNELAAGFTGPLIILGFMVLFIGHLLNLIMCFLSVVVHGVRLNVLEFSGQVGLEWTGIPYEPFEKKDKIKK